jgi:hypothetical protein
VKLWLVGTLTDDSWEFIGIFFTRKKALKTCSQLQDFIALIKLNFIAPREHTIFPNIFFPLIKDKS